jgi:hypothetical protein
MLRFWLCVITQVISFFIKLIFVFSFFFIVIIAISTIWLFYLTTSFVTIIILLLIAFFSVVTSSQFTSFLENYCVILHPLFLIFWTVPVPKVGFKYFLVRFRGVA